MYKKLGFVSLLIGFLIIVGAGCGNTDKNTSATRQYQSNLFKNLTFSYPIGYTIEDGTVSKWVAVKKDEISRVEIFHMSDFGDRPFGFAGDDDGQLSKEELQRQMDGYIPKEQLEIDGFNVWLFYSKDDIKTRDELKTVVASMQVVK